MLFLQCSAVETFVCIGLSHMHMAFPMMTFRSEGKIGIHVSTPAAGKTVCMGFATASTNAQLLNNDETMQPP